LRDRSRENCTTSRHLPHVGADGDGGTAPGGFQRPGPTQARLSDGHLLRALSRLFHRLAQSRPFVHFALLAVAVVASCVVNAYFSKQPGNKEGFAELSDNVFFSTLPLRDP